MQQRCSHANATNGSAQRCGEAADVRVRREGLRTPLDIRLKMVRCNITISCKYDGRLSLLLQGGGSARVSWWNALQSRPRFPAQTFSTILSKWLEALESPKHNEVFHCSGAFEGCVLLLACYEGSWCSRATTSLYLLPITVCASVDVLQVGCFYRRVSNFQFLPKMPNFDPLLSKRSTNQRSRERMRSLDDRPR